jgi:alkanesulfonate monooxygenase SsuD/methylene tetrahydromethanopterin reductase-like flavin-dependent oxidoreductase (luciferase family)
MATNARVGILVPGSFAGTPPTLLEFTAFFQCADDLGLHSLWVIDRIFHTVNILDPMTLLTCAATVVQQALVGLIIYRP